MPGAIQEWNGRRRIRLATGGVQDMLCTKLCGYCYSDAHRGYLTAVTVRKHKCLEKNCPRFEAFKNSPAYKSLCLNNKFKQDMKLLANAEKAEWKQYLEDVVIIAQQLVNTYGTGLKIIGVRDYADKSCSVLYASMNEFDDTAMYKWLSKKLNQITPARFKTTLARGRIGKNRRLAMANENLSKCRID